VVLYDRSNNGSLCRSAVAGFLNTQAPLPWIQMGMTSRLCCDCRGECILLLMQLGTNLCSMSVVVIPIALAIKSPGLFWA